MQAFLLSHSVFLYFRSAPCRQLSLHMLSSVSFPFLLFAPQHSKASYVSNCDETTLPVLHWHGILETPNLCLTTLSSTGPSPQTPTSRKWTVLPPHVIALVVSALIPSMSSASWRSTTLAVATQRPSWNTDGWAGTFLPTTACQARMLSASTMLVQWEPPEEPNGQIERLSHLLHTCTWTPSQRLAETQHRRQSSHHHLEPDPRHHLQPTCVGLYICRGRTPIWCVAGQDTARR